MQSEEWLWQLHPLRKLIIQNFQSELFLGEMSNIRGQCTSNVHQNLSLVKTWNMCLLLTISTCALSDLCLAVCVLCLAVSSFLIYLRILLCVVYSVLLFPRNWETSWNIHLQGSVANRLTNTIRLIPNHFNLTLSIFNKTYWWSLAEDLSSVQCPMDAWDVRTKYHSQFVFF